MGQPSLIKKILSFLTGGRFFKSHNIEEQIQHLIDVGEETGKISEHEGEMIQGIFQLRDTLAREIMLPRMEVVCINLDTPIKEIIDLVKTTGHSRYPIIKTDIDHIIGLLHAKDIIARWNFEENGFSLSELLRPCHFIPENRRINDILLDFQKNRFHMAIVTDEYGGTSGLITIEDILEKIVGDIQDEHDVEETHIRSIDSHTILVDARTDIEDLEEYLHVNLPQGNYESVGGFIISLVDRVPRSGESIPFNEFEFVIEKADQRRVETVKVRRVDKQESANSGG